MAIVLRRGMRPRLAAKKAGKTVEDVVATWATPATYAGYNKPQPRG